MRAVKRILTAILLTMAVVAPAQAQDAAAGNEAAPAVLADTYGRETPRSAVTGLVQALGEQDYTRAANYFDLAPPSSPRAAQAAGDLAKRLQAALDAGGSLIPFAGLSNEATGRIDDSLPPEQEQVGTLRLDDQDEPILLVRGEGDEGKQLWRISSQTIKLLRAHAPAPEEATEQGGIAATNIAGAPVLDWALLLGLAAASFVALRVLAAMALFAIGRVVRDPEQSPTYRFSHAALPPLSLFLAVIGFYVYADALPVSIVARQTLLRYAAIVLWIALAWFALRLVDSISRLIIARMQRSQRRQAVSVITLLRRSAKVLLLAFVIVAILDTLGIDVTTGIAALGIGGIALALGAQKTIENLVGSVTVIVDRPVQVGDFCKVGDVLGTVEDVGMRSTRIRTNDRTVVTIPNGAFSSLQIENYSKRDRFLFNPVIGLEYGISADKMREGVAIIEGTLKEHAAIDHEGARARFTTFGESSLDVEVFSYILASDFVESLGIRQELMLTIMERLEAAGLGIAFPTRTLHVTADPLTIARQPMREDSLD
ncbi:mechanosensitive ion channel family protein [Sphingomonas sp. ac-8]|uniref:mechanosensitive ion channel family protein n=1 Tax=Sphingomonas sp. ac-8 TaxID=3242977 RepID=UPI003A7F89CA